MSTATEHYESHLAPVYLWMAGGFDAAAAKGEAEIAAITANLPAVRTGCDLGAGFGMHAVPLARQGCAVVAVDTSAYLLAELQTHAGGLPIRAVQDDLLSFAGHLDGPVDLILCMGDTLTHLPDPASIERLAGLVAESLRPGGAFVATFRDYTQPLTGPARFVPVRSDGDRILTCFLEYGPDHVTVHDLLHERHDSIWQLRVSAYRKLRLSPQWVSDTLTAAGCSVHVEPGPSGMVGLIATRA